MGWKCGPEDGCGRAEELEVAEVMRGDERDRGDGKYGHNAQAGRRRMLDGNEQENDGKDEGGEGEIPVRKDGQGERGAKAESVNDVARRGY